MRNLLIVAAAALALSGPAFAETNGSSPTKPMMSRHSPMHAAMQHQQPNNKGLGSIRNPTVGNTANQRINGG